MFSRQGQVASRALVVQLARLGDVAQSLPAIESLRAAGSVAELDALCAAPLVPVLRHCALINHVWGWDGAEWRGWAKQWSENPQDVLRAALSKVATLGGGLYDLVYNLNQHARALLASHMVGARVVGAGASGPLDDTLSPWGAYLRRVAMDRSNNRIHLSDAWCGMCAVKPLGRAPKLTVGEEALPPDLEAIGRTAGLWLALAVGAGDTERCVQAADWATWARLCLERIPESQVVLVGSGSEREIGQAIVDAIPSLYQGRVWDATGRTSLSQLMAVLVRCRWVVGTDTGPLHLGVAVGARALGFYFARARVHETGPYGEGHWVYQFGATTQPSEWPWSGSIDLLLGGSGAPPRGWALWRSHLDQWGVSFVSDEEGGDACSMRASIWRSLSPWMEESVVA